MVEGEGCTLEVGEPVSGHSVASGSVGSDQETPLIVTSSLTNASCKFLPNNVFIACRSANDTDADHVLDGAC